jgi:hypothetical protein
MATGTTVDDVKAFLGRDGTSDDFATAGLHTDEIIPYLKHHGLETGRPVLFNLLDKPTWYAGGVPGAALVALGDVTIGGDRFWLQDPALVTVRSKRFEGRLHQVLWTGEKILDPSPSAQDEETLEAYHVSEWVGIRRTV